MQFELELGSDWKASKSRLENILKEHADVLAEIDILKQKVYEECPHEEYQVVHRQCGGSFYDKAYDEDYKVCKFCNKEFDYMRS